MDLDLAANHVLISGASRSIGLAVVAAFVAEGARVSACARTATDIATIAGNAEIEPADCLALVRT